MKKLIVSIVLMSFAVAVQAGDSKTCTAKDKAACSTTKTSTADAGCCSMTKGTTCKSAQTKVLMSPKGAEQTPRMMVASR
jgi:hypothetical protein